MITKEQVIKLYEHLYQNVSGAGYFTYKPKERETKMIENFVSKLPESYGENWLYSFMTYQFSKYHDQKTRFGTGKVMIGWVIGEKALESFRSASEEQLFYSEVFRANYKIENILKPTPKVVFSDKYKNAERNRFFNTDRGLIHCKEMGLEWGKNKYCMTCKNSEYCKV